jgi:hypothetical protein
VRHTDRRAFAGCEKRRVDRDRADVATRDLEAREEAVVESFDLGVRREYLPPDPTAALQIRKRELNHEPESPEERRVQRRLAIRGQDR